MEQIERAIAKYQAFSGEKIQAFSGHRTENDRLTFV